MSHTLRAVLVVLLLSFTAAVIAKDKPKTVKVHIDEEITHLNTANDSTAIGIAHSAAQYFNVTVAEDASTDAASGTAAGASAPAPEALQNDGKWCLKATAGQTVHLTQGGDYMGTLNGTFIHLALPQAKGKPVDVSFSIFDRKWHSRLDIQ